MNRWFFLALIATILTPVLPGNASAQTVRTRPIDQATVRLIGVSGMERQTGALGNTTRVFYNPQISHGSGVFIAPDLIATAAHVVEDLDFLAIRPSGESRFVGAAVVAIDTANDVALVRTQPLSDGAVFPIPDPLPELTPGEVLHTTGFPLDPTQQNPASASGALSRLTNDGLLELSMSLNPGNSGGPLLTANNELIGIVSARGRMDRGVQGVALAVPIARVSDLMGRIQDAVTPSIPPDLEWIFRDDQDNAAYESHIEASPLLAALIAHMEWRLVLSRLVDFNVSSFAQAPESLHAELRTRTARLERAMEAANRNSELAAKYKVPELDAQSAELRRTFGSAPAASGGLGIASVPGSGTPGHRLRVTVPVGYQAGADGFAVADEHDPRFRLGAGFELSIDSESVFQVGFRFTASVDIFQSEHVEVFAGANFAMIWGDGFDADGSSSGSSFAAGAHVGVRARYRFLLFEFSPGLAYLLGPSDFNVYLPFTLAFRAGAWFEPFVTYGPASVRTYDYFAGISRGWAHHVQGGFRFAF